MKDQKLCLTIISHKAGALRTRQVRGEEIWATLAAQILSPLGSETPPWYSLQIKHLPDGGCRIKFFLPDAPTLTLTHCDELTFYVDDLECV